MRRICAWCRIEMHGVDSQAGTEKLTEPVLLRIDNLENKDAARQTPEPDG